MEKYNDKISAMDNVEMVQASMDHDPAKAAEWAKKESFPWPTVLNEDIAKTALKDVVVLGPPSYVLMDRDGKILAQAHDSETVMNKLAEVNK